ncbi:MAG: UDP-3-O-acyl-N-acetylglucosamine deacetylase [Bdellovibrionales bacterium]
MLGDLSLAGLDLRGRIVAYRTGHPHNAELVRKIVSAHHENYTSSRQRQVA